MGNQETKPEDSSEEITCLEETPIISDNVPSTPILTPVDPRSPSANIARTPLDVILNHKENQDVSDLVHDISEGNEKEMVNIVLGIDPRSPTVEFNRTPIIVGTTVKGKLHKLQNKNFDNVLKSSIQTTPTTTTRKSSLVSPKLLASSSIKPSSAPLHSYKRKSFVGLLETNIDFTETDLDSVAQAKSDANKSLPVLLSQESATPLTNRLKDQMDALNINADVDFNTIQEEEKLQNETEFKSPEETVHDEKNLEDKTINVTDHVKDFDKKLTNLIYEDYSEEDNELNVRFPKIRENVRMPLGVRNSNEEPKKTTNKLKVSDKPRKSEFSKIPVFKDTVRKIQCENTPPRKIDDRKIKPKLSKWDADKTLII